MRILSCVYGIKKEEKLDKRLSLNCFLSNPVTVLDLDNFIYFMIKKSIYIKNMVCSRCITAVEQILTKLDIPYAEVKLGEAIVETTELDYPKLEKELKSIGFELIQDKNKILTEQIKTLIIDYIHHSKDDYLQVNFSDFLSEKTKYDYPQISNIFSKVENITIEKFIIRQKIERVKELITYNDLNFTEIAYRLNYSSSAYLAKQFKNITGFTLSQYKKQNKNDRASLDKLR